MTATENHSSSGGPSGPPRRYGRMNGGRRRARKQIRALKRIHGGCLLCGLRNEKRLQRHHLIRWAAGGRCTLDNLVPLCRDCHAVLHWIEDARPEARPLVALFVLVVLSIQIGRAPKLTLRAAGFRACIGCKSLINYEAKSRQAGIRKR